jgi:hypothetical protein
MAVRRDGIFISPSTRTPDRHRRRAIAVAAALAAGSAAQFARAQAYTWIGLPAGSWSVPTNWLSGSPLTVPNASTHTALIDGNGLQNTTVNTAGNFTVNVLTITGGDRLIIDPANTLAVLSQLNNAGTVTINAGGGNAHLSTGNGSLQLTGGGNIVMSGGGAQLAVSGGTVTNANNTISGEGAIAGNNAVWTNQATINANVSGGNRFIDPNGGFGSPTPAR